jgi:hypothetical protein
MAASGQEKSRPLGLTAFRVRGEPITYAEAVRAEFTPFDVGDRWTV